MKKLIMAFVIAFTTFGLVGCRRWSLLDRMEHRGLYLPDVQADENI